jgi:hypothetical protein
LAKQLIGLGGTVARLARTLVEHCHQLTGQINQLEAEIVDG